MSNTVRNGTGADGIAHSIVIIWLLGEVPSWKHTGSRCTYCSCTLFTSTPRHSFGWAQSQMGFGWAQSQTGFGWARSQTGFGWAQSQAGFGWARQKRWWLTALCRTAKRAEQCCWCRDDHVLSACSHHNH